MPSLIQVSSLNGGNVWDKTHSRKEGAFIWSIWHKAIAVNSWRDRFIKDIDGNCLMCMLDIVETIVHRFWGHKIVRRAWDYSIGIINIMKAKPWQKGPWRPLDWQHGIFGEKCSIINEQTLSSLAPFERCDTMDHLGGNERHHFQ